MRLVQLVRFARFHPLARKPTLRQFEEDDGLRFVDFEEYGRMDVDADEHHTRVVGVYRGADRLLVRTTPSSPARTARRSCCGRATSCAIPDADTHSYEPGL